MTCGDLWYTIPAMKPNTDIATLRNYKFIKSRIQRSVSSLLRGVQTPFDEAGVSARKALERGVSRQVILAEWKAKGEKSRQVGTELHDHIAGVLNGKSAPQGFEALSSKSPHMEQFDLFWEKAGALYQPVWTEGLISSNYYRASGRVDALLFDKAKGTFHVVDWKSGSFSNGWNQLLPPFNKLIDGSINLGALQAAMYRLVLEKETEVLLGESFLIHISESSHRIDQLPDHRQSVAAWLRRA